MKRIAVTQRTDMVGNERRESLDTQWTELLAAAGLQAFPAPSRTRDAAAWIDAVGPEGLLLTGGNDLAFLPGAKNADVLRDDWERTLIEWASKHGVPVLGVCRGAQMLAHHHGSTLQPVNNHVVSQHPIQWVGPHPMDAAMHVNSYHGWAVETLGQSLQPLAHASDGTVEAFQHRILPHLGMMWHPERNTPFHEHEIQFLKEHFG